jgi:hypothetical protein
MELTKEQLNIIEKAFNCDWIKSERGFFYYFSRVRLSFDIYDERFYYNEKEYSVEDFFRLMKLLAFE